MSNTNETPPRPDTGLIETMRSLTNSALADMRRHAGNPDSFAYVEARERYDRHSAWLAGIGR